MSDLIKDLCLEMGFTNAEIIIMEDLGVFAKETDAGSYTNRWTCTAVCRILKYKEQGVHPKEIKFWSIAGLSPNDYDRIIELRQIMVSNEFIKWKEFLEPGLSGVTSYWIQDIKNIIETGFNIKYAPMFKVKRGYLPSMVHLRAWFRDVPIQTMKKWYSCGLNLMDFKPTLLETFKKLGITPIIVSEWRDAGFPLEMIEILPTFIEFGFTPESFAEWFKIATFGIDNVIPSKNNLIKNIFSLINSGLPYKLIKRVYNHPKASKSIDLEDLKEIYHSGNKYNIDRVLNYIEVFKPRRFDNDFKYLLLHSKHLDFEILKEIWNGLDRYEQENTPLDRFTFVYDNVLEFTLQELHILQIAGFSISNIRYIVNKYQYKQNKEGTRLDSFFNWLSVLRLSGPLKNYFDKIKRAEHIVEYLRGERELPKPPVIKQRRRKRR